MIGVFSWGRGFFFQAEDGIRDLVRSRGLGDVYKRQATYLVLRKFLLSPLGAVLAEREQRVDAARAASELSLIHI